MEDLRAVRTIDDLVAPSRASGYRYVIYDKRERSKALPYSVSYKVGSEWVRSKGYASAKEAAQAAVAQFKAWLEPGPPTAEIGPRVVVRECPSTVASDRSPAPEEAQDPGGGLRLPVKKRRMC